ncbi:protein-methionine-sulfoxide reductase heme-binding subunit MsrQ [Roseicyclus persicicus]|uniref:Protein-methionine-sulfoxide reductase heme-binding subunit MsrQ n=1 Tax=Roseicyclus persicicus TaxID=2650661 RepID=A0A7X6GZM6_9RHOB|nr:protein-methionine-sulfoxide reductase heme-binding subunit MsrQ [Roseibacterium persicicum]NKX45273.1 protein-methionine-sulfoxide reductase heme-binding subunit MsrQ [Roseibacterium persicicum]
MAGPSDIAPRAPLTARVNQALRRVPAWTLYIVGAGWGGWLFWLAATGGLGVEPIEALEHRYGELALQLMVAGLAVTPLRQHLGLNLMPFRRAIGVLCIFYVVAHFLVWAVLDVQRVAAIWADIVERPYVTIGMAAFLMLIPLGLTSNDWAVRRLGGLRWRKLHRLVYPAAVLGALHYVWLAKGFQVEPLVYLLAILGLLALRIRRGRARVAG